MVQSFFDEFILPFMVNNILIFTAPITSIECHDPFRATSSATKVRTIVTLVQAEQGR